jgi:hypothetical protein
MMAVENSAEAGSLDLWLTKYGGRVLQSALADGAANTGRAGITGEGSKPSASVSIDKDNKRKRKKRNHT